MGIPAFYGWLVRTFPGVWEPAPASTFDNVYLDMNSIIHPCFHPEDENIPPPADFQEVFQRVGAAIDNILSIARPSKLLYMPIDGVAPKAKMNQQRSRRFAAAKERLEASLVEEQLVQEFVANGRKLPEKKSQSEVADSNIITPGTSFMEQLSAAMQTYVSLKVANDPQWSNLKVILSDSKVPGEGEHKIVSFIRRNKQLESYDANTSHCIYGADADLILLSLASHERQIWVLREAQEWRLQHGDDVNPFELVDIASVREQIVANMLIEDPGEVDVNYEHVVDDFVFMCSMVGNDFIPHVPSLMINDGALESLMKIYKREFSRMGGYLTRRQNAEVNMGVLEYLFEEIAKNKEGFLKNKYRKKKGRRFRKRRYYREYAHEEYEAVVEPVEIWENAVEAPAEVLEASTSCYVEQAQFQAAEVPEVTIDVTMEQATTVDVQRDVVDEEDLQAADVTMEVYDEDEEYNSKELRARLQAAMTSKMASAMKKHHKGDTVDLGAPGYKTRYYTMKLGVAEVDVPQLKSDMTRRYVEGLAWVFKYYLQGLCSWGWFYPYGYAPFASDFGGIGSYELKFELGQPLKPLEQLMAVLPPQSAHALPECYKPLMLDPASPIADFYPLEFGIDYFGIKSVKSAWKAVVNLPLVDNSRLLAAVAPLERCLAEEEAKRNVTASDLIFGPINSM